MMRATLAVNDRLTVEADGAEVKDVFEALAGLIAVLGAQKECGCCQSANIVPGHRLAQGYNFYELRCRDCDAQFRFGQMKETLQLFPKTKDEAGNLLPNGGWSVYKREQAPVAAVPPPRVASKPNQQRTLPPKGNQYDDNPF